MIANSRKRGISRAAGIQSFQEGYGRSTRDRRSTPADKVVSGAIEGGLSFLSPSAGEYASHVNTFPDYGRQRPDGSWVSDRQAIRERDMRVLGNSGLRMLAVDTPTMIGAVKAAVLVTAATGNPIFGVLAGIGTKIAENFIVHRVSARRSRQV